MIEQAGWRHKILVAKVETDGESGNEGDNNNKGEDEGEDDGLFLNINA